MKTANQIGGLLPVVIIITTCSLMVWIVAFGSGATLPAAVGKEPAPKGARTFWSARHFTEIFSKFPSSASRSAFPKEECEAECGFWHSFRTSGRQEGDYKDHVLPDHNAFVPDHDHILPYHDHDLPYLDAPLPSPFEGGVRGRFLGLLRPAALAEAAGTGLKPRPSRAPTARTHRELG